MFSRKPPMRTAIAALAVAGITIISVTIALEMILGSGDQFVSDIVLDLSIASMLPAFLWLVARMGVDLGPATRRGVVIAALVGISPALVVAFASGWTPAPLPGASKVVIAAVAVLPQSLTEELLFRVIIPVLVCWAWRRSARPSMWGWLTSTALFAVWHLPQSLSQALDHFLFGLLMIAVMIVGRSVWAPVVAHFLTNMTVVLVPAEPPTLALVIVKYMVCFTLVLMFRKGAPDTSVSRTTAGDNRIVPFDILRACALGLIIFENAMLYIPAEWESVATSEGERVLRAAVAAVVEFRGLPLFAMLLGFSLYSVLRAHDAKRIARFRRRNKVLFALGAFDGIVLFSGDILAVFGIVLTIALFLLRERWNKRGIVSIATLVFVAQAAIAAISYGASAGATSLENDSWTSASSMRIIEWAGNLMTVPLQLGLLLPVFVGYFIAQLAFDDRARPRWVSLRLVVVGIAGAGALSVPAIVDLLASYGQGRSWVSVFLLQIAGVVGAGAVMTFVLLTKQSRIWRTFDWLVPLGRSTLSGYLLANAALLVLMPAFGFDISRLGLFAVVMVSCGFYAGLLVFGRLCPRASSFAESMVRSWTQLAGAPGERVT